MSQNFGLADRLLRIYAEHPTGWTRSDMIGFLAECSKDTRDKMRGSTDEELYRLMDGNYPDEEFYRVITGRYPRSEPSPLAVRLARLHTGSVNAETMQKILLECSSDTVLQLRESTDEEIYTIFAGHPPRTDFYEKLMAATPSVQVEIPPPGFRQTYVSSELRKILELMDALGLLKNEAKILALDAVMPRTVRHVISTMHEDLLGVCVNGESIGESKMVGEISNITITIDLPPTMDSYLEIVFAAVEESV